MGKNCTKFSQHHPKYQIFPIFWTPQIPHQVVPNARFTGGSITTEVVCEAARQVGKWTSEGDSQVVFFCGADTQKTPLLHIQVWEHYGAL